MNRWITKKIADIADVVAGGTPSTNNSEFWNGDIGWITPADLSGYKYRYIANGARNISSAGLNNSSAYLLPKNTVLLSSRAPIGYVAIAEKELATNQGFKNLICDDTQVDYRFMYYWLQLNADALKSFASGATFPELSAGTVKKIKVTLPDIVTQNRIADILFAYDELIEANTRRIELLEQAAQELYKEWFVRFHFPGYESIKFENGVPEDWNVSKLSQISDFVYGKMPQQEHVLENGFPIFSGYRVSGYYDSFMFEEPMLVLIARGVGGTGEVKISPPCAHITNLAIVFKLNNPDLHKRYLYHMFTLQNLRYLDTGAAQSQITIENLKNVKVILPTDGLLEKFNIIIAPFYEEQDRLKSINENLINQRDLLLPRLISGKLEV